MYDRKNTVKEVYITCGVIVALAISLVPLNKRLSAGVYTSSVSTSEVTQSGELVAYKSKALSKALTEVELKQTLLKLNLNAIRPMGKNVYYFPFTGPTFRETLPVFMSQHTNLEFSTSGEVSEQGVVLGYTIFFLKK